MFKIKGGCELTHILCNRIHRSIEYEYQGYRRRFMKKQVNEETTQLFSGRIRHYLSFLIGGNSSPTSTFKALAM